MKALQHMNNVEKGKLLADLFPEQLPNIKAFIEQETACFIQREDYIRNLWSETFLSPNFWFGVVRDVEKIIKKYGSKLTKNSRLFADQLFDGYNEIYTIYCLIGYTTQEFCNYNLKQAIYLFFGDVNTNFYKPKRRIIMAIIVAIPLLSRGLRKQLDR